MISPQPTFSCFTVSLSYIFFSFLENTSQLNLMNDLSLSDPNYSFNTQNTQAILNSFQAQFLFKYESIPCYSS